jgi:hypothetical protein
MAVVKCHDFKIWSFKNHIERALSIFLATNHILCWQMGVKPYFMWIINMCAKLYAIEWIEKFGYGLF